MSHIDISDVRALLPRLRVSDLKETLRSGGHQTSGNKQNLVQSLDNVLVQAALEASQTGNVTAARTLDSLVNHLRSLPCSGQIATAPAWNVSTIPPHSSLHGFGAPPMSSMGYPVAGMFGAVPKAGTLQSRLPFGGPPGLANRLPLSIAPPHSSSSMSMHAAPSSEGLPQIPLQHQQQVFRTFYSPENPFHSAGKTLMSCPIRNARESSRPFVVRVSADRAVLDQSQTHVFLFCADMGDFNSGHKWPPNVEVRVNGQVLGVVKATKKTPDRPLNITNCFKVGTGVHEVYLYHTGYVPYCIIIAEAQYHSPASLVKLVLADTSRRIPHSVGLARVRQTFGGGSDDEHHVMETHHKMLLTCPSTLMRVEVPVKGPQCTHARCFDLESYYQMNERVPKWRCPVCNKVARPAELLFDEFADDVLKQTADLAPNSDDEIECVMLLPDGKWSTDVSAFDPECHHYEAGDSDGVGVKQEDGDDSVVIETNSPPLKRQRVDQVVEIQIPSDSETDTISAASSAASVVSSRSIAPAVSRDSSASDRPSRALDLPEWACALCRKPGNPDGTGLLRCSACRYNLYCGGECQRVDWPAHKVVCESLKLRKEASDAAAAAAAAMVSTVAAPLPTVQPSVQATVLASAPARRPQQTEVSYPPVNRDSSTLLAVANSVGEGPAPRKPATVTGGASVATAISLDSD